MAINKNFVIKNGVQVSTDLIIGDADTNKVGIGTTIPGYDLHVGIARGSRGGIGATDIVVTGVGTIANLSVTGPSTFAGALDVNSTVDFAADVVFNGTNDITYDQSESALVFNDGAAIRVGTSSDFSIMHDGSDTILRDNGTGDLKLYGSRIEIGGASVDETIAFFTENAGAQLYFNNEEKFQTVAIGATIFGDFIVAGVTTTQKLNVTGVATVGGALSLPDNTKAQFGTGGDLLIYHDSSNSYIDDQGTGDLIIRGSADIKLQSASGENYIIANDTGSVEQYFDNSKKTETTSGGFKVTGITTLTDRLHVEAGISTFDADVRFGIGATVGFGTSAFFRDNAAIFMGNDEDLKIFTDQNGDVRFQQQNAGKIIISSTGAGDVIKLQARHNEESIIARVDGAVEQYYDNTKRFETTGIGATVFGDFVVSGVTTSARLLVSGISTFTGLVDANGGAHIDNLRLGIDADNDITTSSGNLTLDSTGGTVEVNDNLQVDGQTDLNGDINLGNATSDTITATGRFDSDLVPSTDGARNLGTSDLEWSDLHIDGTAHIDTLDVDETAFVNTKLSVGTGVTAFENGNLAVAGIATITDRLHVQSGISTFDDTTQSTSATTGAVVIDGGLGVAKNVNIGGNLTVTGTTTLNGGTVTLGDANTDNVVFSADVDSNIIPDDDDSFDLGSSTKEWQDLFLDGTAHIDVLDVDETAFVTTKLTVGTGVTIQSHGGVSIAGITTTGDDVTIGGTLSIPDDIEHSGDTNTKIRFPAADTVTVETAGAERLRITDVGIATFKEPGTGNGMGGVVASTANAGGNAGFQWATNSVGRYQVTTIGSAGAESLRVYDINNGAERVRITNVGDVKVGSGVTFQQNGNVAIAGITTIGGDVTIHGATPTLFFTENDANPDYKILTNGGDFVIQNDNSGSFVTKFKINPDGHVDIADNLDALSGIDVTGALTVGGGGDVTLTASVGSGSSTILFDSSTGLLTFQDNLRANFGTGSDLSVFHDGTRSVVQNATGNLDIITGSTSIDLLGNDGSENLARFVPNGEVILYHNDNARITTTDDGTDFGGTGSIRVPNGTTGQRNASPQAGDFRYNTTDGKFEGYTTEWGEIGGSGGVEETDTSVSTTSATSCGSFAKASFRSAAIIAQITQGSNYQVGRYLLIHDGTTVTTLEESAVATGSMLGTFEGVINGSNVEFRVTMGSSSSATVTTKIDTVTV